MSFDLDKAQSLLEKWQDILRLRDWDIILYPVEQEWRKTGDVKIDADDKRAVLMLNTYNPKQINLEEVIIHELLHIKLWGMDQMIEGFINIVFGDDDSDPKHQFAMNKFFELLEVTVEDLAKGYVTVGAENREPSFGRVMQQVTSELQ